MIKFILFFGIAVMFLLPLLLGLVSAAIYGIWRALTYETRFRKYFAKYDNNDEVARMIASGRIWTGQTADQLRDAKGAPLQITQSGNNEIWIYKKQTLNPGSQIVLTEGRVQHWS